MSSWPQGLYAELHRRQFREVAKPLARAASVA